MVMKLFLRGMLLFSLSICGTRFVFFHSHSTLNCQYSLVYTTAVQSLQGTSRWLPFSLVQNIILQSLYACHDLGGVGKAQKDGEGERMDQDNDCERLGGLQSFGGRLSCLLFHVISCSSVSEYCL